MSPAEQQEIRCALLSIMRDPSRNPGTDELRTVLINDNWAQPYDFIDMADGNKVRRDWRIGYRGEQYLIKYPPTADEKLGATRR